MNLRALALAVLAASVAHANPSGKKWFNMPVNYRIAASVDNTGGTNVRGLTGPTGGPAYATVVGRTQAAFTNWTQSKVTTCPGATSFNYNYTGTFASPSGGAALSSTDNQNSVIWLSGSAFQWGSSTLGITFTQYFPATGELDEADMAMNNNTAWSDLCAGAFQAFDYESVILHEAGHFLGLDHTPSVGTAVMFPSVSNGDCKRALQANDITDVCTVYPPGTGSQGSSCTSTANCSGGRVCRSAAGSSAGICTINCPATCPTGFSCQNATGTPAQACFPTVGSADLCKFCSSGAACSTGQCVTDGAGHFFCSLACTSAAQCGPGYNCINTTAGGLCAPTGQCNNQCVGTGQSTCPVGYNCVNGLCDPTGNPGDHCELSEFCKPCNVCIGTNTEAYCRTCCGGADSCNNCPNPTCASGNACLQLNGETGKVCIPQTGAMLCQACSATTPCLNGLSCLAGACHNTCNPQSPGACGACLDQGGTNGVCACPSEVATVGNVCGVQANGGFFACQNGLVCSSGVCRTACQTTNPNSCSAGFVCTTVSGKDVCLPSSAGARCAACATSGNPCAAGLTCQAGRCYEPCNVNAASTCGGASYDCVQQVAAGDGICACPSEKVGNNLPCSSVQPIKSCNQGLRCIDGYCRAECNIAQMPTTCAGGLECRSYAGAGGLPYCQVVIPGTGGGGGTTCVANSMACTMPSQCCSGNCVQGPTTTICAPAGAGGGGGTSGTGGGTGTGGGSAATGGGTGAGGSSGVGGGTGGGATCDANGVGCTTGATCCSGKCGAGPGGTMVCQVNSGAGGGSATGTGGGSATGTGGGDNTGGGDATGGSGTGTPPGGCGCNTGVAGFMVWQLFAMLAMFAWKRRR